MRLSRLTLCDVGPYRGAQSIDLSDVSGVVAVTGPNGCGKSTLLRAVAAFHDRTERLVLAGRAQGHGAYIEAEFASGPVSRVRLSFDAVRGTTEAAAYGPDGASLLRAGQVTEWDEWAASHLIARSIYGVTIYSAQGGGGWTDLPTAERRSVVLRALGIDRLERLAKVARERADALAAQANDAAAEARGLDSASDVVSAEATLARRTAEREERERLAESATLDLFRARSTHAALVAAYEDADRARAAAALARDAESAARERLRAVSDRQENCRRTLLRADEVDAAVAALPSAQGALASAQSAVAGLEPQERGAETARGDADLAVRRAADAVKQAETEERRARTTAADLPAARAAAESLPARLDELAAAEAQAASARQEYARLTDVILNSGALRIGKLREALTAVSSAAQGDPCQGVAADALLEDDKLASEAAAAPAARQDAITRAEAGERLISTARAAVRDLEARADRVGDLERAHDAAIEAAGRASIARESHVQSLAAAREAGERLASLRAQLVTIREDLAAARKQVERLSALAALAPEIAAARALASELAESRQKADADLAAAREAVRLAPEPPEMPPVPPDLTALERSAESLSAEASAARAREAAGVDAVEAAKAARARRDAIFESERSLRSMREDALLLADTLGQKGIIALEVDAAGPELSSIANDLLRSGFGTRWTVSVETVRPRANGDGEIEVCDVSVIDTLTGYSGPLNGLSGGEAVVVSEAIRMALTTLALRRLGLTRPTLLRDEPGAALSGTLPIPGCDTTAPATEQHLAMLRRAAQLADATVLLVSHDAGVPALCDARVRVGGGTIQMER